MKDMLNRDIVVGDTLAMATGGFNTFSIRLKLCKVIATSGFAVQTKSDGDEHNVVFPDTSELVICDWAKGSDAAK